MAVDNWSRSLLKVKDGLVCWALPENPKGDIGGFYTIADNPRITLVFSSDLSSICINFSSNFKPLRDEYFILLREVCKTIYKEIPFETTKFLGTK